MTTLSSEVKRCIRHLAPCHSECLCISRTSQDFSHDEFEEWNSISAGPSPMMAPHIQVMAILERIKRQDAGEIEPPAIAIGGKMGANPASEDFVEQSAAASRQQAAEAVGGDGAGNAIDLPDEVCALLRSAQKAVSTVSSGQHSACMSFLCVQKGALCSPSAAPYLALYCISQAPGKAS